MKNWSTQTKWIVGILIISAIVIIYMNWNKISSLWNGKSTTRQYMSAGSASANPLDYSLNLPSANIGLTDSSSAERQSISHPAQNPYGYSLCYKRIAILNKGNEDLGSWQGMVDNTFKDIKYKIKQARDMGYKIAIIINAPQIVVGAQVEFYVYAGDCNSQLAKEVVNYIQNLH